MFEKTRAALARLEKELLHPLYVERDELNVAERELAVERATSKTLAEREAAKADAERAVNRQLRADLEAVVRDLGSARQALNDIADHAEQVRQRAIRAEDAASKLQADLDAERAARRTLEAARDKAENEIGRLQELAKDATGQWGDDLAAERAVNRKLRAELATTEGERDNALALLAAARGETIVHAKERDRLGEVAKQAAERAAGLEAETDRLTGNLAAARHRASLCERQRDEARADAAAAEKRITKLEALLASAQEIVALVKTDVDGVWRYQGDGEDHPESLSCPVIMSAERLRALLHGASDARAALKRVVDRARKQLADRELIERYAATRDDYHGILEKLIGGLDDLLGENGAPAEDERKRDASPETLGGLQDLATHKRLAALTDAFATHAGLDRNDRQKLGAGEVPENIGHGHGFATAGRVKSLEEAVMRLCQVDEGTGTCLDEIAATDARLKDIDERLTIWVQSTQREIHGLHTRLKPFELCEASRARPHHMAPVVDARHEWDGAGICAKCGIERANCP